MIKHLGDYIKTEAGILELLVTLVVYISFLAGYFTFKSILIASLIDFLVFALFLIIKLLFFTSFDKTAFGWTKIRLLIYKIELLLGTLLYICVLLVGTYGGLNYLFQSNDTLGSLIPLSVGFGLITIWRFVHFIRRSARIQIKALYILPIVKALPLLCIVFLGTLVLTFDAVLPIVLFVPVFLLLRYYFSALEFLIEKRYFAKELPAQKAL